MVVAQLKEVVLKVHKLRVEKAKSLDQKLKVCMTLHWSVTWTLNIDEVMWLFSYHAGGDEELGSGRLEEEEEDTSKSKKTSKAKGSKSKKQ